VSDTVLSLGYKRGRNFNWYKSFPDLIQIIGLQKASWGGENYLEAGIWLKVFGPDESPKFNECHVRFRLDAAFGLDVGDLASALYEDDLWKMDNIERTDIIKNALVSAEKTFFAKVQNLEQLKLFLIQTHKPVVLVQKEVKELFGFLK